jgi:hypothetical protein
MTVPFVESTHLPRTTRPQRWRYIAVPVLLLLAAVAGPAYYLYATSQPVIGANIGAGLGLGWTWLCGMPWSTLVPDPALNTDATLDRLAFWYTVCALLNVALAAVASTLLYRRRRRQ